MTVRIFCRTILINANTMKPILVLMIFFAAVCAGHAQKTADTLIYQNKKLLITQGDTANSSRMEIRNNKAVFTDRDGNPIDTTTILNYRMEYIEQSLDLKTISGMAHVNANYLIEWAVRETSKKIYFSALTYYDKVLQIRIPVADFTITKIQ